MRDEEKSVKSAGGGAEGESDRSDMSDKSDGSDEGRGGGRSQGRGRLIFTRATLGGGRLC